MSENNNTSSECFDISFVDDQILVTINGQPTFIDTGAHVSIGSTKEIKLLGDVHTLSGHYIGKTCAELSKYVGKEFTQLLGTNILRNYYFELQWVKATLTLHKQIPSTVKATYKKIPLLPVDGIPHIECVVGTVPGQCFIDTGAPISYIRSDIARRYKSRKLPNTKEDFYPGFGTFNTELYSIPVVIGDITLSFNFGVLPSELEDGMLVTRIGVLGSDLFKGCKAVGFDLIEYNLYILPKKT